MNTKSTSIVNRIYPWVLSVGGVLGLVAMTWQVSERVSMLKSPTLSLSCSINPVVDCSGVLGDRLSAVFGPPNALFGMIFFAILASSGLMLLSGGKFKRWYRHFVMAVSLILFSFSGWFFGVSLYTLGKICTFCVVGWVVSVPIFWYGSLYYLQSITSVLKNRTRQFTEFGLANHFAVLLLMYALMIALFLFRFRGYYF